jgi:hypothetical protein
MGQLAPNSQRAVRVVCSSPKGDDRKLCETSSFKNSSRRFMIAPLRIGRDGRASAGQRAPTKMRSFRTVALAASRTERSDRTLASTRASLTLTSEPAPQLAQSDTIVAHASSKTIV